MKIKGVNLRSIHNKFHKIRIPIILSLLFTTLIIDSQPSFAAQEAKPMDEAMDNLTQQIVKSMKTKTKQKVAVIDFSGLEGQTTELNKFLSEELTTRLFKTGIKTGRFEVIERRLLAKVLAEQKLSFTGIFAPETMKELGQILGADAIVTGTITDLGTRLRVNARIISTETGKVSGAAAVYTKKGKKVLKLLGEKLPGRLQVITFPAGVTVFVDNESKGISERQGTLLEIPPGLHTVVLKKKGFKDFGKKLFIGEDETRTLKVKFASKVFREGCSGCLISMIIPGGIATSYNNLPGEIAGYSGIGFYVSAAFHLIDRFTKPETFLTKEQEKKYDDIVKKELYAMGGFYIANVFFSTWAGIQHGRTHKVGVEISFNSSDEIFGAHLVYEFK